MIYLDNAATSFPKPEEVYQAVDTCLRSLALNPKRSNSELSLASERIIYNTRKSLARLLNIKNPNRIIFTFNATDSLNMAIKGILNHGDNVITSHLEHNSVTRALTYLQQTKKITVARLKCTKEGFLAPEDLRKEISPKTRLIILTHASNVIGTLLPIKEAGRIAREYQIPFLVDAAQTVGLYEINVEELNIDLLAFSGHKGLLGPQGTGGLYIKEGLELSPLRHGGTGSQSEKDTQPEFLPDKYESGTLNTPGIAGLGAGVDFILKETVTKIREHEKNLTQKLLNGLKEIEGITIYGPQDVDKQVSNVSFNLKDYNSQEVSDVLSQAFGITTRGGLHCSPWTHELIGTYPAGAVRLSPGYFNKEEDIEEVTAGLKTIACLK